MPPEIRSGLSVAYTHDWGYVSEPSASGPSIPLLRGKLVGGCSATNAAIALRGEPSDYDEWAMLGNPEWGFAEVLPVFRRLENDADFAGDEHGQTGPVPIRREPLTALRPEQNAFLQAALALGHAQVADHNALGALGVGVLPKNLVAGVRQSAALTHLAPARKRPNLTIQSGALVDQVVFEGRRAVGVRLHGVTEALQAKQVILAAGAFGSPAILMRSGIGPAEHLAALDIPVVQDLPGVGQNLIDHPLLSLPFVAPAPEITNAAITQVFLTLKSSLADVGHDLQIFLFGTLPAVPESHPPILMLCPAVVKPISRGQIRLKAPEATVAPKIDMGYFADATDLQRMLQALQAAWQLAQTPPLSAFALQALAPQLRFVEAGPELEAAVRAGVNSYGHPVGTCRMGPETDALAVVNSQGWVHGVKGLAVVDASMMPTIVSANPNLSILMLAERCAAWLTKHH